MSERFGVLERESDPQEFYNELKCCNNCKFLFSNKMESVFACEVHERFINNSELDTICEYYEEM